MRKKIILYILFVLLFALGKYVFMLYYHDIFGAYSGGDWWAVLYHGLPHDLTCAGYLMALPFLLQLVNIWIPGRWHLHFMHFWLRLCLVLVLLNFLSDLFLYGYWGFRLDATALIYLFDNPLEALGQAPIWMLCLAPLLLFGLWWPLQKAFCLFYRQRERGSRLCLPSTRQNLLRTSGAILSCGLLFVAIRGGVTTSTMNVGRVYFSSEMPLNHAATNPFFSFFHSVTHQKKDFAKQYRFLSDDEAARLYAELNRPAVLVLQDTLCNIDSTASLSLTADTLLRTTRPNIVLLILESFSGAACTGVCPSADSTIMPNVNRMYQEGIGFNHLFANSFRTDRGCAAILAGYPGQPTNSVMKDQLRCNRMPHLSRTLKEQGYELSFTYGGDVNFTNMRGFLTAGGFENIVGDTDFPLSDRLSKWGVPDHVMFNHLFNEVSRPSDKPFFHAMLTLSSHEPFDVEYHHFDDPYLNSVAYTDSCIGSFIDRLKHTPAWDNLLIIGVADHAFAYYPQGIQNHEILRYRIPMFWTGGAIREPRLIETLGSQTDLTATLLHQLGINADEFTFSKDILDPAIGHYAFYAFSDGFGLITDSCQYIQDNAKSGQGLSGTNDPHGLAEKYGKAYLQTLYDDLNRLGKQ